MPALRGRVSQLVSRNEETGETVARLAPEGDNPKRISYPFQGTFANGFFKGECLDLHGEWTMDDRLGKVFQVNRLERRPPMTREGEEKFLCNVIKGMRVPIARMLLNQFGSLEGLVEICHKKPELLDEALPKSRKLVARLRNADWASREMDMDIFAGLHSAGLKDGQIQELVRFFGTQGLKQVAQQDPYAMCQVPKIGFVSAEKVAEFYAKAQERRIDLENMERLVFGLVEVTGRQRMNGHVCVPEEELLEAALPILKLPKTPESRAKLAEALSQAIRRRLLIKEFDMIYPRGLRKAEHEVATRLAKLLAAGARPLHLSPAAILKELKDTKLSDEQKQSVVTMATSSVSILVGGPGRGKTWTLATLLRLLDKYGRTYLTLAPTGKAAKRAAEVSGKPCYTIHKACGLEREEDIHDRKFGGQLSKKDRLNVDVVIIDETSMVDLPLGFEVIRRVKAGVTAVIFVGDPDQLPPVGPGQLLKDLLSSAVVPIARLTQVFRQAGGSPIVDAADALNEGRCPVFRTDGYEMRIFDPSKAKGHPGGTSPQAQDFEVKVLKTWLTQAILKYAKDLEIDPLRDVQVYAPQKNGVLGLDALNFALQELLNPVPAGRKVPSVRIGGGYELRAGDKVMQVRNNYKLRLSSAPERVKEFGRNGGKTPDPGIAEHFVQVMNGQVGYVTEVTANYVAVVFDDWKEPVHYLKSEEWRQLAPAYAMSIHRSQGSETPYAFIVLHDSMNPRLVNRPLIYTGETRAKKGVAFFATLTAVTRAAENLDGTQRHTNLHRRLQANVDVPRRVTRMKISAVAGNA